MNNKILSFFLSHHFLLRGWERTINKPLLYKVLPHVEYNKDDVMVIAFPSFLMRIGVEINNNRQCLVLVIKNQVIVTGYWCQCIKRKINSNTNHKLEILY